MNLASYAVIVLVAFSSFSDAWQPNLKPQQPRHQVGLSSEAATVDIQRRTMFSMAASALLVLPQVARADISDGTSLPKGAQQFNRVVRLKKDLKKVRQRVETGASEMDKTEWDNVGKFLRDAYATGNDMKDLAVGIANKSQALDDIDKLQKYAQAADVTVNKQDAQAFIEISLKMSALVDDYFNCLYDVPETL